MKQEKSTENGVELMPDEMVDRLVYKLEPVILRVVREELSGSSIGSGMLTGSKAIADYMGLVNPNFVAKYVRNYGFPVNKNPRGKWWITKTMIDDWMYNRHIMMKKALELGIKKKDRSRGRLTDLVRLECLTQAEKNRIVASIMEVVILGIAIKGSSTIQESYSLYRGVKKFPMG